MKMRKMACMVLSCVLVFGAISIPAKAAEEETIALENRQVDAAIPFAIGSFSMSIPAKSQAMANSSFSLAAGETVTIKASYYPFSASVDVGLVAPDGKFYYFNITNGSIDKTIQVSESGKYTLMVRNNSSNEIEVSGFVNY